jgi:hypothetical protein
MKKFVFAALVCIVSLTGCKTAEQSLMEQGGTLLSVKEAENIILGNTLAVHGSDSQGRFFSGNVYVAVDGNTHAMTNNSNENRGLWAFKNDGLCIEWTMDPRWGNGCANVYKKPDGEYAIHLKSDGREISSFSVSKGNPKNL